MSNLTYDGSEIVDTYCTDVVVPDTDREPATEVALIGVGIRTDDADRHTVTTIMRGYRLTNDGQRRVFGARLRSVYDTDNDEARYNLAREATIASLERHGIRADQTDSHFATHTWAERRAAFTTLAQSGAY